MAEESTTALTERGVRTRERLIQAAREVFEEMGFLDTRVRHITERAGAAYGTFYTYFDSKEAVLREVADRIFADMTGRDRLPLGPDASPRDRVSRANRSYYTAYLRNARMMAIIEQVATFNEEFREMRRRHRASATGRSARAIRRWQSEGLVDAGLDADLAARALAAMVDHSLYLRLVQGEGDDTERFLDTLDALTVRALGLDRLT
ncbi:TetR/AcrR family transcriptional regulator [Actinoallomurus iriomotensis]|jgi:AcrR family transcriptional regulator|uniref:Transcriptional regulatory protein TetR n=1 Tax=Actinoallomurus iriomotensis TaxID=478107 RepID=A0A9W6S8S3_9ACTN|nr:TetR/AcrR family transcriptional regulator [Actinoallomurus iriomotensis]GLY90581.1 putative transcriptional regulatory protein TetR [Actinoallomurus iriomotensis]